MSVIHTKGQLREISSRKYGPLWGVDVNVTE